MGRFIARRLAQGLLIIFGVTVFVFVVTRIIGDPVKFMLPLSATEEQREATRHALGLDQSIPKQFVDFVGDLLHLDLGTSTYVRGEPALDVVFDYLPRTLELVALGMLLAMLLSIPLGLLASRKPGGVLDRFLTTISADRAVDAAVLPRQRDGDPLHRASCRGSRPASATGRHTSSSRRCASPCRRSGACRWWCARR